MSDLCHAMFQLPEFTSFRARREGEPLVFYVNAALDAAGTTPQRLEEILQLMLVSISSRQPGHEAAANTDSQ